MPPLKTKRIAWLLSLALPATLSHAQVSIPDAMPAGAALQSWEGYSPPIAAGNNQEFGIPRTFRSLDFTRRGDAATDRGSGGFARSFGGDIDNRSDVNAQLNNNLDPILDLESFGLPFFDKGMALENADLSLGPFGINFHSLTGSVLSTDNYQFDFDNPQNRVYGSTRLNFSLIFQPLQNLHLLVKGDLIALPFEKKIGLNGFGMQDPIGAALGMQGSSRNLTHVQLYNKWDVGENWEVEFLEDYSVQFSSGSSFLRNFQMDGMLYAWDPLVFDEIDPGGEFEFTPEAISKSDRAANFDRTSTIDYSDQAINNFDTPSLLSTNTLANTISFLAPLETDVTLSNYRQDRWDTCEGRTTQDTTIGGRLLLANSRKNLRFQPFGYYKWTFHPTTSNGWSIGIRSQLTDNMKGITNFGNSSGTATWRIAVRHQFNSRNLHAANFSKVVQLYNIQKTWDYRFSRVMGFGMTGDAIIRGGEVTDRDTNITSDQLFFGLGISKVFSPALTYTNTLGYKDVKDPFGIKDHSMDMENRIDIRHWEYYTFMASHKWRFRNPGSIPGSVDENIFVFEFGRTF